MVEQEFHLVASNSLGPGAGVTVVASLSECRLQIVPQQHEGEESWNQCDFPQSHDARGQPVVLWK